jgi:transmembrane sensor
MTPGSRPEHPEEALRREAAAWMAKMRGDPSDEDRGAFEDWYRSKPEHARAYDRIAETVQLAGLLAGTATGRGRSLPKRARFGQASAAGYAIAATLVAAIGLALILSAFSLNRPVDRGSSQPLLVLATAMGEIRTVSLADGSRMTLDTNSAVTVEIGQKTRDLTLRKGRARFSVRPDARPFRVKAGQELITARGTVFDVSVVGNVVRVAMLKGSAAVAPGNAKASADSYPAQELRAGEEFSIGVPDIRPQPVAAEPGQAAWPSGMLVFENTPLREVALQANRYSDERLVLRGAAIGNLKVTGTFRAGDTAGLARSLAAAFGLTVRRSSEGHHELRSR